MSASNGHTNRHQPSTAAPTARPKDTYLGPCCEICNTPWKAHPRTDQGKPLPCAERRPEGMEFDTEAWIEDRKNKQAARRPAPENAPGRPATLPSPPKATDAPPQSPDDPLAGWRSGVAADVGVKGGVK